MAQDTTKNSHLRHQVIRSLRDKLKFGSGTRISTCRATKRPIAGTERRAVLRNTLLVARGRVFGEGCPNLECHAPTGFRANRRGRTSGPDEGGGTAKQ